MIEIIPAINVDSFEEAKDKLKKVEPYVEWAQLDVADGTFTKNTLWHNPDNLIDLKTSLKLEVHLMISNVEKRVIDWILPQVNRIIFHLDATVDPGFVIAFCKTNGKDVGVAFGPDIPWTQAMPFIKEASFFQVLGVYPGLPGQKMQEGTIDKIRELHNHCPSCIIEVDGGVNSDNVKEVVQAGATRIVMANAIFKNEDIENNIKTLKELIFKS